LARSSSGVERLEQVVDRPRLVGRRHAPSIPVLGRDEEDGHHRAELACLDEPGRLEAVRARHLHVEQDEGELLFLDPLQRLRRRHRAHGADGQRLEQRLEGEKVLGPVIDDQDCVLRIGRRRLAGQWPLGGLRGRRSFASGTVEYNAFSARTSLVTLLCRLLPSHAPTNDSTHEWACLDTQQ
jgi:hypothetical protein